MKNLDLKIFFPLFCIIGALVMFGASIFLTQASFAEETSFSDIELTGEKTQDNIYTSDIKVTYKATNMSGIKSVQVLLNNKEIEKKEYIETDPETGIETFPMDISEEINLTEEMLLSNEPEGGQYTLLIKCIDAEGKESQKDIKFFADLSIPSLSIKGVENGKAYNENKNIKINMIDKNPEAADLSIKINKNEETILEESMKGDETFEYLVKDEGEYSVIVSGVDKGEHKVSDNINFIIDKTDPVLGDIDITGDKREGYTWFYDNVDINSNSKDILSGLKNIRIFVNEKTVYSAEYNSSIEEENISHIITKQWISENESAKGRYEVRIEALDMAGNDLSKKGIFYADVENPDVEISGISDGEYTNNKPTITVGAQDNYKEENTIYINVIKDGKKFDKKNLIAEGEYDDFKGDGEYQIQVKSVDKAGNESTTKKVAFIYDTTAPVLSLTGAKEGSYTKGEKTITAKITEKYYNSVNVEASIVKEFDGKKSNITFGEIDPDKENYTKSRKINGTGTYTVKITAIDKAGNIAKPKTLTFTIDNYAPEIEITDVSIENGYKSTVAPKVTYRDSYFESREITLSRTDKKDGEISYKDSKNEKGGSRVYNDFKKIRENDGIYTLTCEVTDKAGNSTKESKTFKVNRFGSVYEISNESKKINDTYMKKMNDEIVITEKNVTGLKEYEVTVMQDGMDVEVDTYTNTGTENGWKTYKYNLSRNSFSSEGVYDINITSVDSVGNFSEFKDKDTHFKIYIDKTAPQISVSGIEEGGIYKGEQGKMTVAVNDTIKLKKYTVKCDNRIIYDSENKDKLSENKAIVLPSGFEQNIEVSAVDMAGNINVKEIKDVTISNSFFERLFANRGVFIGIVISVILLVAAISVYIIRKRRTL